jgi:signal transduction histidine kinase
VVAIFADDGQLGRQIDVTTEPVWVDGDPVRLDQVLTNIMTNAVKYTRPAAGFGWRSRPTTATRCSA